MGSLRQQAPDGAEFAAFVGRVQPRLQRGLVATYGVEVGREATADALCWAWEHFEELEAVQNQAGYLYRVGQSAARRYRARPYPPMLAAEVEQRFPEFEPRLLPALERLSEQQRTVVVLVHVFGWSQADVAGLLDVNPSTVREHLTRALVRLREDLEVRDVADRG